MDEMTTYEENMLQIASAQYIMLCRIYDFLSVIADKMGSDALSLRDMHAEGKTFSPPPYLEEDENED